MPAVSRASQRETNSPVPIELVIRIIDHVRHDRSTVTNCSLVCKAWLPIAHDILFNHIHISLSENPEESIYNRLARIVNQLACVRALTLSSPTSCELKIATILGLARRLPNLTQLELSHVWLQESMPTTADPSLSSQPCTSVNRIKLREVYFGHSVRYSDPVPNLFNLIFASFPEVEHLLLHRITGRKLIDVPAARPVTGKLRTLSYHCMNNLKEVVEGLQPFVGHSLRMIDYTGLPTPFDDLLLLCNMIGNRTSLRSLRFCADSKELRDMSGLVYRRGAIVVDGVPDKEGLLQYWSKLKLRSFTSLHSINIVIRKYQFFTHPYVLATLPDSIRIITFELCWGTVDHPRECLNGLDARYLEKCVENLPFLEEIRFVPYYLGTELEEDVQSVIRSWLSGLMRAGYCASGASVQRLKAVSTKSLAKPP